MKPTVGRIVHYQSYGDNMMDLSAETSCFIEGARHQHALDQAALLKAKEEIACGDVRLKAALSRVDGLVVENERIKKNVQEGIKYFEAAKALMARQALSGDE